MFDRSPRLPWPQPAGDGTRKLDLRLLPVTERGVGVPHFARCHLLRDLEGTDIARFLDHALDRQGTVVVRVADGEAADLVAPGRCVDDGVRRHAVGFQRHGDGDRLHGRAGLEGVGHGAVAQLFAGQVFALVGHITRVVGQCQHLACDGVQHHHAAGLGTVRRDGVAQLLIGKELDLAVNAELDVFAIEWRHGFAHAFDDAPQPVLDHAARTCLAGQVPIKLQLDAFLAAVFHVGETHHMRSSFAFGVLALVFLALVNAFDVERGNLLADRFVDLALDPDKALVLVLQLFVEILLRHAEQTRDLAQLDTHRRIVALDVFGNCPDARGGDAGRQDQAVAVQHTTAIGRQRQGALETHGALALVKIIVNHLHIGGAAGQPDEAQGNQADDQLAAPDRCLAGQQRAGGVLNAAGHGATPVLRGAVRAGLVRSGVALIGATGATTRARGADASVMAGAAEPGALEPSARTYWVMAGVGVRMESCSLASRSTRSGVAWARFSTCNRSLSISIRRASVVARSSSVNT